MPVKLRLKNILDERGISQRKLALEIGVRPATINHLCKDSVEAVYLDTLDKICVYLKIELSELMIRVD